jgi:hypothetical protein
MTQRHVDRSHALCLYCIRHLVGNWSACPCCKSTALLIGSEDKLARVAYLIFGGNRYSDSFRSRGIEPAGSDAKSARGTNIIGWLDAYDVGTQTIRPRVENVGKA